MSPRVINFGPGPAQLPKEVLLELQRDLLNYAGTGLSVMELSHRADDYVRLNDSCQECLRGLLNIPNNYHIIFMQGGGSGQFAAVPLNLIGRTGSADYVVTGVWSEEAAKEAAKYGKVNLVLPRTKIGTIQDQSEWNLSPDASYVYYCDNETVDGVEFDFIPDTGDIPLIADMSSNILTRTFDIWKFGAVYAVAQKNFGPAGVVVVIIRDDILGDALSITPKILDYTLNADENSMLYTPPAFQVFAISRNFEWIKRNGGVKEMEERSLQKSKKVYDVINKSNGFYVNTVEEHVRSRINIPFRLRDGPKADALFLKGAENLGIVQIKGFWTVGGIRVSLYNSISLKETEVLVDYMKTFMRTYKK